MKIPAIRGLIDRRILINFTADPDVVQKLIPSPFKPKIYQHKAIVGICLIRLKNIRPKGLPSFIGISSENSAHRIAVEWNEDGELKGGVYIPRRDTSLKLNALVGGRLFPGKHHLGKFSVKEADGNYHVDLHSSDGTSVSVNAREVEEFAPNSIFGTLENVSDFFQKGDIGYSPRKEKFDGLRLYAFEWKVKPLEVLNVGSSFFEDERLFPKDSVKFDNALLMTRVEHEWRSLNEISPKGNLNNAGLLVQ